jgi:hypothetical protein
VVVECASNAHRAYDQLNGFFAGFCPGFLKLDGFARMHQVVNKFGAPAQQILVLPWFVVSAVRQTEFLNQCFIFPHECDYNKILTAVL